MTIQLKHAIYPCTWFDGNAKQAADLYSSVFADTEITSESPMVVTLRAGKEKFMFLNGGPMFTPNPSISFFVICQTETEADSIWAGLGEGGNVLMPLDTYPWSKKYGWLKDRFGVSWQIMLGDLSQVGQKYSPSLMFTQANAGKAEEAIDYYTSVFSPSNIGGISRYAEGEGDVAGYIKHAQFSLGDTVMMAMDSSGPHQFTFNEGVSLVVECESQQEIDYYWERLTDGGVESQCGWLKDRFGVSWQIIPAVLPELMKNPEKAGKVMQVVMQTKKFDIAALEEAAG
ncbi:VOC family protein [Hufsiella ginkgonis]|uniref:VOC family protein n=1 Tax=Hufsiella ginkgonis TaxID=2695274 RepID=A0A7K1Y2I5_9SPHI|nr:VOC family protein [Hufsiella ginkgonis]MXV17219.1 VOC family protein [Hufsiella ginkgonis]